MLSRWKLMAGVLGVSIGGLAAAASQCPKWDRSKGRTEESPVAKADPKVPPAGAPSAPVGMPTIPAPTPEPPAIPAAPQLAPGGATPILTPPIPTAPPASVDLPKPTTPAPSPAGVLPIPEPTPAPASQKTESPTPPSSLPAIPPTSGTIPTKPESKPSDPFVPVPDMAKKPIATPPAPPTENLIPPAPTGKPTSLPAPVEMTKPVVTPDAGSLPALPTPDATPTKPTPPVVNIGGTQPAAPAGTGTPKAADTLPPAPPAPGIEQPAPMQLVQPPAPAAAPQFRIILRVGDGEPMFEVKNGDNLVLKVACEKVDIKSPEKGGGLSEVTARGNVRFAGFGAEGTCTELKFMAGTGEVSMTGEVKVQVKDKLGRVESELTTGSMKYKIDSSSVGGQIKP